MKIESKVTHHITQAIAAISVAIWKDIDFLTYSDQSATIASLEVDQAALEKEILKWGKDNAPITVTADLNVFNEQNDMSDGGEYEYDFWEAMKYEIVLRYNRSGLLDAELHLEPAYFTATAKRMGPEKSPVTRTYKERDPIAEIMRDPKFEIEEAK